MNPVIGILIVGFIWVLLFIAPNLLLQGSMGVIALIIAGLGVLVAVFWWKVIITWIKQL